MRIALTLTGRELLLVVRNVSLVTVGPFGFRSGRVALRVTRASPIPGWSAMSSVLIVLNRYKSLSSLRPKGRRPGRSLRDWTVAGFPELPFLRAARAAATVAPSSRPLARATRRRTPPRGFQPGPRMSLGAPGVTIEPPSDPTPRGALSGLRRSQPNAASAEPNKVSEAGSGAGDGPRPAVTSRSSEVAVNISSKFQPPHDQSSGDELVQATPFRLKALKSSGSEPNEAISNTSPADNVNPFSRSNARLPPHPAAPEILRMP